MADNTIFKAYLAQIEHAYKAGNATEHTYRPALKDLLEAFQPSITATNESRRIKCGAPDYIINRKDIPLGFVEAKDIGEALDKWEKDDQLLRYREGLANLILTDYLEFDMLSPGAEGAKRDSFESFRFLESGYSYGNNQYL